MSSIKVERPRAGKPEAAAAAQSIQLLDVLSVKVDNPSQAVKSFPLAKPARSIACDVLVVGGGTGGVAAALQASLSGLTVCLTEETDWLGGQMTSQGVSALDENYLVETSGSTMKYQQLRNDIREHYRSQYQLAADALGSPYLNPGNCWVSCLSFEPKVAVAVLHNLLKPATDKSVLSVYHRLKPVKVRESGGRIRSVLMLNLDSGESLEFHPRICLDATELGDLLPLLQASYRVGSESQLETGEPHAPLAANPKNVQDFVFPFAIEYRPGEDHTIAKPALYERFSQSGLLSFFGYKMFDNSSTAEDDGKLRKLLPFWTYRRLLDRSNWVNPPYEYDLAMINWMANDLPGENIIDEPAGTTAYRLGLAKSLSLSFLYWLQTQAPRDDGGSGYPELALRPEVMGTADGLSKYPYIRESRRIKALHTVVEQDISAATTRGARARLFPDPVGIGFYPIDIHGAEEKPGAAQPTRPFQLPLGALIPEAPANLIASAKNIGTTHITNGAYRLHPIEWAIGEAAGALAVLSLEHNAAPRTVAKSKRLLRLLQQRLVGQGVPLYWFDDVPVWHPAFPSIQFLAITGVMPGSMDDLHFSPDDPLTRAELAAALAVYLKLRLPSHSKIIPPDVEEDAAPSIVACIKNKLISVDPDGMFRPSDSIAWSDLEPAAAHKHIELEPPGQQASVMTRADFARWLYEAAVSPGEIGAR